MAHLFNIYFDYNDILYSAVVSVHTASFFIEYSLSNMNEDLANALPGNKIISKSPGVFIFQNSNVLHSTPLMNAIINAVKDHIQTVHES